MTTGYWANVRKTRISRRRAITAMGGTAAAAAFLAACGGDDDDGGSDTPVDNSGLLVSPKDETSGRKRGGSMNIAGGALNVATATLEQSLGGNGSGSALVHLTYSQLMRAKMGTFNNPPPESEWEPEFAQSYEQSADGLSVTFKLRGMKFDNRPPTNGRTSTSADVKYSWDRFVNTNTRAPELANSKSPDAPIIAVETPDEQTVVLKLAFPFAPLFAYLGSTFFPHIYPKEADGGYETKSISRGTGAWTLPDSRPTGNAELTRNPNYYHQGEPYFDKLTLHNISETAAIHAQMQAGAIDFYHFFTQEDMLKMKKDNPKMVMYQRPYFAKGCGAIFFGRKPGSPWNDERVRKALAMSMDADLWGDNYSNREKFEAEGLPVNTAWFARGGPGYSWWLDPTKDEFGSGAKWLKHNPAEAKKLIQAAGISTPITQKYHFVPNPGRDPLYQAMLGIYESNGDFKFEQQAHPDFNLYLTQIRNTGGNFDGISPSFYFDHHDFDWTLYLAYHPSSTDFWMGKANEDKKMTELVLKQRRELDNKKREEVFQEFVRYDIDKMYYLPYHFPVDFQPYFVAQPWIGGWGWHQPYIEQNPAGAGQIYSQYWFDESKKT